MALMLPLGTVLAQQVSISEGTVLQLVKPAGDFEHLQLPRKNIILKQGGIANHHHLDGKVVVVEQVQQLGDQHTVVLKRQDGRRFLRRYKTLTARWPQVLQSGELRMVN